jgi:hypothetical protein
VSCVSAPFHSSVWFARDPFPTFVSLSLVLGLRTALGNRTTQAEAVQPAYNSLQQELEELRAAALEVC